MAVIKRVKIERQSFGSSLRSFTEMCYIFICPSSYSYSRRHHDEDVVGHVVVVHKIQYLDSLRPNTAIRFVDPSGTFTDWVKKQNKIK